jgi:hypothetical protein
MRPKGAVLVFIVVLLGFAGQASASGITNASEDLRTGWYPNETAITPELIEGNTFGQEWSTKVEGQVAAQPLLFHGTVLIATERNQAYGLDPATGNVKWSKALPHGTPWNPSDIGCADLTPAMGVTATPVIDTATGTAYMTHETYANGSSGPAQWWMDAIETSSGAEKPGFPVELGGEAQNIHGVSFNATNELQRPGLLLMEGVVYAAFGSHCDHPTYQGWVFGVSTEGAVRARWAADSSGGGIWQSGAGLTSDGAGQILMATGNGSDPKPPISKPPSELGQSVVRLQVQPDGSLKAVDFFMPYDANELNTWDADFGSGGVTGLPSQYFGTKAVPDLAVAVGKDGYVYLLNRDDLGGYGLGQNGQDRVAQRIGPNGGVWSRPGVWPGEGGWVYIPTASAGHAATGNSGNLDVYRYGLTGGGEPTLTLVGSSSDAFGFSSGAPVITSKGTEQGSALVWIVWSPNGSGSGSQLRAYLPKPKEGKPVMVWSHAIGTSSKFSTPGVGLGRMYVGTRDEHVLGFGSPVTPALSGSRTEFPVTTVGASSERTLTLEANRETTIEKIDSSDAQFVPHVPALPLTLKTGQKIMLPIVFTPTGAGPQAGTLRVLAAGGTTLPFSMSGEGQASGAKLEATPPVLTFGGTTIGSPVSAAALLKNVGSKTLTMHAAALPVAPFQLEGSLPEKLEPGQEVSVPISFDPSGYGEYSGVLELESTGGSAAIHMTGVAAPPGLLAIAPERTDFGQVAVGGEALRSFTITNVGGLPVKINISKPPIAGEFRAITSLPEGESEIDAHQSVSETVRFAPTASGSAADVWRITGQDAGGLHEVQFTGEGVPAAGSPTLVSPLPAGNALPFKAALTPLATLARTRLLVSRSGVVSMPLSCSTGAGTCRGSIALATRTLYKRHGHWLAIRLAGGPFAVPAGASHTIRLQIGAAGRALLRRHRTLSVTATLSTPGARTEPVLLLSLSRKPARRSP